MDTNPTALQTLVENHRRFLAFLEPRVGSRDAAEEVLQDALARSIAQAQEFDTEDGVVAWFYRVLRNALVDRYRRHDAEGRGLERLEREASGTFEPELESEVCRCMRDLLPTLKPEYARLLEKVDLQEGSVTEAAAEEGITSNNANVRLHRARQALKQQLVKSCGTCAAHGCLDCTCGAPRKDGRAAPRG